MSAQARSSARRSAISTVSSQLAPGATAIASVVLTPATPMPSCEQTHLGAEASRRDRLVGALAATAHEERAAGDRLAGAWQVLRGDREVDVRGADYEDAGRGGTGGQRRSRNRRRNRSVSTPLAIRQVG